MSNRVLYNTSINKSFRLETLFKVKFNQFGIFIDIISCETLYNQNTHAHAHEHK